MRSGGTPSRSLTIWVKAVSLPWPIEVEPVKSATEPSALTRTSAVSGLTDGVGTAGDLDRIGDAEPEQLAARAGLRPPLLEARPVGQGQRHVHAAREVAAVVGEDEARS